MPISLKLVYSRSTTVAHLSSENVAETPVHWLTRSRREQVCSSYPGRDSCLVEVSADAGQGGGHPEKVNGRSRLESYIVWSSKEPKGVSSSPHTRDAVLTNRTVRSSIR